MRKNTPKDWQTLRLKDLFTIRDERHPNDGTFPLSSLTIENGVIHKPERYIREFLVKSKDKAYKKIYKGDLVFNPMNLRWGAISVSKLKETVITSPVYQVLFLKGSEIGDIRYLEYIFRTQSFKNIVNTYAEGTLTERTGVNLKNFLNFPITLPSLGEQRKIVSILSTIDSVIEKTQAVIDQTQLLKKGLMQELFTRGIRGRHKRFKKTEIGEIPDRWKVEQISNVSAVNPSKKEIANLPKDTLVSFIPMENIDEEGKGTIALDERRIGEVENGYTYFAEGDILFAKITPCMENGKTAIMTGLRNNIGFGSTEFHVLRPYQESIREKFLFYWIIRKDFRMLAQNYFTGTAGQQRVQSDFFSIAKIPLPSLEEQEIIVKLLDNVVLSIETEIQQVERLKYLKSALMQVLLTGEARVT